MKTFFASLTHAIHGIIYVFHHELNFRIQLFLAVGVMILSWILPLRGYERIVVLLLIIFILVLELVNSAIEKFTDIIKPRLHTQVKIVKDIMAATVFISALGASIIGASIFIPYVIELFAF